MTDIELPNGDVVEPGDVILFEGYAYHVRRNDGIVLSPVYWGDSELDLAFETPADLAAQWGDDSAGDLTESEWAEWLADAREDDRFDDPELDAIEDAVRSPSGTVSRIRRWLGLE